MKCVFCEIARSETKAVLVYEDEHTMAFLDTRPLFAGHVLLIPRQHIETLAELPGELTDPLFGAARRLARAVQAGMAAEGTFVAINNVVSQSVPHLHVHIVPRRKGDGLRGFFWPRSKYRGQEEAEAAAEAIRQAL